MKRIILLITLAVLAGASAGFADQQADVLAVMNAAEAGWNAGDLEAYMQSYWHSDQLRFAGGDRVNYGWEKVLAGYQKSYPDKAAMGTLTFSEMDVTLLGAEAAIVFGHWHLDRAGDQPDEAPQGLFTLLLRRLPEGWRIVHDHTSAK
jgi:uncharacterized protein (TIGR02246 family)